MVIDEDNNIITTGITNNGSGEDFGTVKFNMNGNIVWIKKYNGGYSDDGYEIAVDLNRNIYVTGSSYGGSSWANYATVKYDSAGAAKMGKYI